MVSPKKCLICTHVAVIQRDSKLLRKDMQCNTRMYVCTHTRTHAYTHTHTLTTHTHTHSRTHACTHARMHARTHTHTKHMTRTHSTQHIHNTHTTQHTITHTKQHTHNTTQHTHTTHTQYTHNRHRYTQYTYRRISLVTLEVTRSQHNTHIINWYHYYTSVVFSPHYICTSCYLSVYTMGHQPLNLSAKHTFIIQHLRQMPKHWLSNTV